MKRCPECRRDYVDDSLLYCLEDGTALVQGAVPSPDGPQTAILHEPGLPSETIPTLRFAPSEKKTIAILPFKNLTGNEGCQFYEFSLADAVITELARLRSLIVRPSSIIAKYLGMDLDPREAGMEMSVESVLSAGFIYSAERVRVTAQLIDVSSGRIIWSESIDTSSGDIFAVQDTITRRILEGLDFNLSLGEQEVLGQRPTKDNEAYEEYLRGRDKLGRFMFRTLLLADCDAAIDCFVRATDRDPEFALAWSGLGACFANKTSKGIGGREEVSRARTALTKALSLDPGITEAHVLMGYVHLASGDKTNARAELDHVQNEYPGTAATYFLKGLLHRLDGEYDDALESWTKLERLDPASIAVSSSVRARIYCLQGNPERALEELARAAAAEPDHPLVKLFRVEVLFYSGDIGEASRLMDLLLEENPQMDGVRPLRALILASQNRRDEAIEDLSENALRLAYVDQDVAYWTASAYSLLREKETALEWLERAVNLGLSDKIRLQNDKNLDALRDDPRLREYRPAACRIVKRCRESRRGRVVYSLNYDKDHILWRRWNGHGVEVSARA
jgi:serine/threonine-protein kinase